MYELLEVKIWFHFSGVWIIRGKMNMYELFEVKVLYELLKVKRYVCLMFSHTYMHRTMHESNTQDTACNSEKWGKRDYIGNSLFENKITVKIASVTLFDKLICVFWLTNNEELSVSASN